MYSLKAPQTVERALIDGATLAELKRASKNLRDSVPDSVLADLADEKIKAIENGMRLAA
jgi:hypothetical protein